MEQQYSSPTKTVSGGLIIMLDGPDGIGKTTQITQAVKSLKDEGYDVYKTRIHGGTPMGEALRNVSLSSLNRQAKTDMYISLAIHSELMEDLRENRAKGIITLVDRSPLTIIACQAFGSGLDKAYVYRIVDEDIVDFNAELIIVYQADLPVFMDRINERKAGDSAEVGDYFQNKSEDYFKRVVAGYADAAKHYNASTIDASSSIDDVHDATMRCIHELIESKRQ